MYTLKILSHYLILLCERQGMNDPDVRAEINALVEELGETFTDLKERVGELESLLRHEQRG